MSLLSEIPIPGKGYVEHATVFWGQKTGAIPTVKTPEPNLYRAAKIIQRSGERWKINPAYLWGIFGVETSFGSDINVSSTGAKGPFQFEPATAKQYGYPTGVNEHGNLSTINWSAFEKQADAAAHYLNAHGGTKNITGAVKAYNPGESSYLSKVEAHAKSFAAQFGGHMQSEQITQEANANPSGAEREGDGGIWGKLQQFGLYAVLLLAGAFLIVYGIMMAVKPADKKPNPLRLIGAAA
jgi:hypothetical protein